MTGDLVVIVHAAATWAMVGLIWFVQVVHYPLFAAVGAGSFVEYENHHTRRTLRVVGVLMPIELGAALVLVVIDAVPEILAWTGAGLVVAIWMVTAFVQAPQHGVLGRGFQQATWRSLVRGNWIRTATWSARGIVAAGMLASL